MKIPEETVDAAVRVMYGGSPPLRRGSQQDAMRADAREVIEACAPYIRAAHIWDSTK